MSAAPVYKHLISKALDPVFAVGVGVSAAVVRVRREEKEAGHNDAQIWETLKRRLAFSTGLGGAEEGVGSERK